ncbi:hypothetical protein EVAR_65800_1 [Eumeta japonica]|uniref:Uncharacterized protein n=1 Tax=Eumeta variegata TaxID=151549 RepID=A0A4C1ZSJ2_EUMVA|nr:hypothetical protein EVAR_65800_1 [Eumeta japonica]
MRGLRVKCDLAVLHVWLFLCKNNAKTSKNFSVVRAFYEERIAMVCSNPSNSFVKPLTVPRGCNDSARAGDEFRNLVIETGVSMTQCQGEHVPRADRCEGVLIFHVANITPQGTRANPVFVLYSWEQHEQKKKKLLHKEGEIEATGEDC